MSERLRIKRRKAGEFNDCALGYDGEDGVILERATHTRAEAVEYLADMWGFPASEVVALPRRVRWLSRREMWRVSYAYHYYDECRGEDREAYDWPAERPARPPKSWDATDDEYQSVWRFAKWYERGVRVWLVQIGDGA